MKLRSIAIISALALASAAAHAQIGVYATFDAQNFTRTGLLANPPAGSTNSASPWLYGPIFGAYYTVSSIPKLGKLHTGPVAIGIDVRGDILRTSSTYARADGLIGLRVTPKKPIFSLVPYLQGSAGIGHTKVTGQLNYTNNWSYQAAVGVDHKIKGRIDWRVVEGTAGFLGSYQAGTAPGDTNYNYSLSSGMVVRLGGK
jgi:hypothetical protein